MGETYNCKHKTEISAILNEFLLTPTNSICIVYSNFVELVEFVKSEFRYIRAAGGVVENNAGHVLAIFRHGLWDLPKGKAEKGESIEQTAIREVEEETGAVVAESIAPLCDTWHIYDHHKGRVLKQTFWYSMICTNDSTIAPQTNEGITEVAWLHKSDLPQFFAQSYASLRDVITHYSKRI